MLWHCVCFEMGNRVKLNKQTSMRLFFTKKELKLRKKRVIMMIACMAVLLASYLILTWPKKIQPELPTVIVEPAEVGDVEIFGEYVGRIRAQQFVEVRARVEGYLESMLFAEGTYITKTRFYLLSIKTSIVQRQTRLVHS